MNITALIMALCFLESTNNSKAVNGECVGILQEKKILVDEVNRILDLNGSHLRYAYEDRWIPEKAKEIAQIFFMHHLPRGSTPEYADRLWHWGKKGMKGKIARPGIKESYAKFNSELSQK